MVQDMMLFFREVELVLVAIVSIAILVTVLIRKDEQTDIRDVDKAEEIIKEYCELHECDDCSKLKNNRCKYTTVPERWRSNDEQ